MDSVHTREYEKIKESRVCEGVDRILAGHDTLRTASISK